MVRQLRESITVPMTEHSQTYLIEVSANSVRDDFLPPSHPNPVSPSAFYRANPDSLLDHSRSFLVDARCRFEPTDSFQRKSIVYGLNGHRSILVID
jgi:hypothetical protein